MTREQLKTLEEKTGRGSTVIYKVAAQLGRAPYAWEVVFRTNPRGRRRVYCLDETFLHATASIEWNRINCLMSRFRLDNSLHHWLLLDAYLSEAPHFEVYSSEVLEAIKQWGEQNKMMRDGDNGVTTPPLPGGITSTTIVRFLDQTQDILLAMVCELKKILYGGV